MSRKQNWGKVILVAFLLTIINHNPALANNPISEENQKCLTCHSNPDSVIEFASGSSISGHVSSSRYNASVHGQEAMTCGGCHPNYQAY